MELRVLEGPNLYFPRAAVKLTLDISHLASAPTPTAERLGPRGRRAPARAGAPWGGRTRVGGVGRGERGTGFRQRLALRAVARLVRAIARESGTVRLAVR